MLPLNHKDIRKIEQRLSKKGIHLALRPTDDNFNLYGNYYLKNINPNSDLKEEFNELEKFFATIMKNLRKEFKCSR